MAGIRQNMNVNIATNEMKSVNQKQEITFVNVINSETNRYPYKPLGQTFWRKAENFTSQCNEYCDLRC